jgi:hypothetical protein
MKARSRIKKSETSTVKDKIDFFLLSKSNYILGICLFISAIIFYKLFDIRVNIAGDDTDYILAGYQFLKEGIFPTWHSPLYSVFLALPIALFGVSLVPLKITSSILFSLYFLYITFKNRIDSKLLIIVTLIISINSFVAFYSAFTFGEAFYMFFQALFLFYAFKLIESTENKFIHFVYLGLILIALYMAKTVGIAGIGSLIVFFALQKNWKKLIFSLSAFGVAYLFTGFIKKVIWGVSGNQFSSQLQSLMQKDPYNAALGNEDVKGYFMRIIDNSNLYISKHFFRFLGFRPFDATTIEPVLTILFYLLIIIALYFSFRNNKYILLTIIYTGAFLGITFIMVQKVWDQDRLIIPVFTYMLLLVFWAILKIFQLSGAQVVRVVPYLLAIIVLGATLKTTTLKIDENKDILSASLKGNIYYGYTPDWENYLKMCAVSGEMLNDTALVACRKSGMAFIYGKQMFYGINNVPTTNVDSLLNNSNFYYSVPVDDLNANFFNKSMIKGLFYGQTENKQFVSDKMYFLFESENKLDEFYQYETESKTLKAEFSTLFLYSPDELLNELNQSGVDYIIAANLRAIPDRKTDRIITTVRRYMQMISIKYPETFKKIYEIGQDEKAELFEIHYPAI